MTVRPGATLNGACVVTDCPDDQGIAHFKSIVPLRTTPLTFSMLVTTSPQPLPLVVSGPKIGAACTRSAAFSAAAASWGVALDAADAELSGVSSASAPTETRESAAHTATPNRGWVTRAPPTISISPPPHFPGASARP